MRNLIFSLLAAILPLAASAADNVTTFRLQNGMDAVVIEDHRAPVVTHMVWYRIGSADEKPGKSGIAHLLEHLMFKGTLKFGPGVFSDTISANGGSENAFTSYDYTAYYQRVAADRLALMMEMEADRMRGLILSEEDVATERDVVLEERNTRTENNPGALFSEQRMAAQYLNHGYGVPIIGWKHEVSALNRADALDWYWTYYAPNNAILVVAGDVDPVEVVKLANKYYGAVAPTRDLAVRQRPTEPPQISPRRLSYADARVARPYVIRTYLATERNPGAQKEAAALEILAELLGGNSLTSVMGRKLQLEQKIALSSSAYYDSLALDQSGFGVFIVPEAEDAVDAVIAEFLETGVDEAHLTRIKAQVRAAEIYARDDLQGTARRYGEGLTSGLTIEDIEAWPDILQAVTAEDIMAAANRVFDKKKSVTGWLMREEPEASE
jgi:zinc protease